MKSVNSVLLIFIGLCLLTFITNIFVHIFLALFNINWIHVINDYTLLMIIPPATIVLGVFLMVEIFERKKKINE